MSRIVFKGFSLPPLIFIVLFIISTTSIIFTQNAQEFSTFLEKIVQEINDSNPSDRPKRLAVMTFISTSALSPSTGQNEFGEYLTESIISALAADTRKFKIIERKRLDLILKENALILGGIINENQAIKLGELAPIDLILSGTYTKLEDNIDINSRLIDVVTGEVMSSIAGTVILTDNLASLFYQSELPADYDPCRELHEKITYSLLDLSSQDKVQNLIEQALAIPFDTKCGIIHFDIMRTFKKYQIENHSYCSFLEETLKDINYPSEDNRAYEILRFFKRDGVIDQTEWQYGLSILNRVEGRDLSSYFNLLLDNQEEVDLNVILQRIDTIFELIEDGEIGLPVAVNFNTGFFEMIDAFNYLYAKDNRYLAYCYEIYADQINYDDNSISNLNTLLKTMYIREQNMDAKIKILGWLSDFYNKRPVNEKMADDIYSFIKNFEITSYKQNNPEKIREAPPEHLKLFIKGNEPLFCTGLSLAKFRSQREERMDFCLENNIPCPGEIPSIEECILTLKSRNWNQKTRSLEILVKMGKNAAPAESAVNEIIARNNLYRETETSIMHKHAATILGNIHTNNPESIKLLVKLLGSLHYMVPNVAQEALVKIGKPAVPYLIDAVDSQSGGVQYKAIVTLGGIGPEAIEAKSILQTILKTTNNNAIRQAIESSLQAIEDY